MGKLALCIQRNEISIPPDEWKPVLIDRDICESDPETLQLLPYITLVDKESLNVFMYQRGKAGGENRLKDKWSIGLGGHVDVNKETGESISDLLAREACREIEEEVGLVIDPSESAIHDAITYGADNIYLYMPYSDNPVEHVHLGLHFIEVVDKNNLGGAEKDIITNGEWVPISKLVEYAVGVDKSKVLEYWTVAAISNMVSFMTAENLFEKQTSGRENASPELKSLLDSREYLLANNL